MYKAQLLILYLYYLSLYNNLPLDQKAYKKPRSSGCESRCTEPMAAKGS